MPKFYYGSEFTEDNPEGVIIMGDLSENGETLKMIPGFDNEQVSFIKSKLGESDR